MRGQHPTPVNPEVGPRQGFRSRIVFQPLRVAVHLVPGSCLQRGLDRMAVKPEMIMADRARAQQFLAFRQ